METCNTSIPCLFDQYAVVKPIATDEVHFGFEPERIQAPPKMVLSWEDAEYWISVWDKMEADGDDGFYHYPDEEDEDGEDCLEFELE